MFSSVRRSSAALLGNGHLSRAVAATRESKETLQLISTSCGSFPISRSEAGLGKVWGESAAVCYAIAGLGSDVSRSADSLGSEPGREALETPCVEAEQGGACARWLLGRVPRAFA